MPLRPQRETDWPGIGEGSKLCEHFQMLVVSAIKIYKQYVQTASAFGWSPLESKHLTFYWILKNEEKYIFSP